MSKLLRSKCPKCGNVQDVSADYACSKCGTAVTLPKDGVIQIYRMGSPIGVAVGYGIYINGNPCGHLANTESIRIPVPYGTYTLHFTCGATRRCQDLTVEVTPENRIAYVKARIKMGFWTNTIIAESSRAEDMSAL